MASSHQASCHCGQLRLSFSRAPVTQLACHCEDCRAISGKPFTQAVFFAAEPNCIVGESTCDSRTGGSGKPKHSHCCCDCGDFVYAEVDVLKGLIAVNGECLKPPFEFVPHAQVWTSQKLVDVRLPDTAVVFEKAPALSLLLQSNR